MTLAIRVPTVSGRAEYNMKAYALKDRKHHDAATAARKRAEPTSLNESLDALLEEDQLNWRNSSREERPTEIQESACTHERLTSLRSLFAPRCI